MKYTTALKKEREGTSTKSDNLESVFEFFSNSSFNPEKGYYEYFSQINSLVSLVNFLYDSTDSLRYEFIQLNNKSGPSPIYSGNLGLMCIQKQAFLLKF